MTHDGRHHRRQRRASGRRQSNIVVVVVLLVFCSYRRIHCVDSVVVAFVGPSRSPDNRQRRQGQEQRQCPTSVSSALLSSKLSFSSPPPPLLQEPKTAATSKQQEACRKKGHRWYGKTQQRITEWCDIPKSQKRSWILLDQDGGSSVQVFKRRGETVQHPLVMAILWKLFRPAYPNLAIEQSVQDPDGYIPDVVATDEGKVVFWGESGRMSPTKAAALCRRYPHAHIVHCRWGMSLEEWVNEELLDLLWEQQQEQLVLFHEGEEPAGRFTFASLPCHDVWRFIDPQQRIQITKDDFEWMELQSWTPQHSLPWTNHCSSPNEMAPRDARKQNQVC